jgi:hypothetical protein
MPQVPAAVVKIPTSSQDRPVQRDYLTGFEHGSALSCSVGIRKPRAGIHCTLEGYLLNRPGVFSYCYTEYASRQAGRGIRRISRPVILTFPGPACEHVSTPDERRVQ